MRTSPSASPTDRSESAEVEEVARTRSLAQAFSGVGCNEFGADIVLTCDA